MRVIHHSENGTRLACLGETNMLWILIYWLASTNAADIPSGVATHSVEFFDEKACVAARDMLKKSTRFPVWAECFPKR